MKDIQAELAESQKPIECSVFAYLQSQKEAPVFELVPLGDARDTRELTDYVYGEIDYFTLRQSRGDHKHFRADLKDFFILRACRVNIKTGIINADLDIKKYLELNSVVSQLYATRSYGHPIYKGMPFIGVPGTSVSLWLSDESRLDIVNDLLEHPSEGDYSFRYPDMNKDTKEIFSFTYFLKIPWTELAGVTRFSDYLKEETKNDSSSGS